MYDRRVQALACAALLAGTVGCASSGPFTPSPEQSAALAAVAGVWRYDEAGTAQAAGLRGTRARDHIHQRASDIGMEMMREQGAGGDAVSGTPTGLRQTMLMLGITHEALTFSPGDGALSATFDSENSIDLPLEGSWVDAQAAQGPIEVRLRWRGDGFAIERRIPGGGTIRDAFSILESGHLLLTREIVWRRAQMVGRIVYDR